MRAAFVTPRQALVDAVAIGLIGDDENAAVGMRSRSAKQKSAGHECIEKEC